MTVEELIKQLEQMPQHAVVTIAVGGECTEYYYVEYKEAAEEVQLYTT